MSENKNQVNLRIIPIETPSQIIEESNKLIHKEIHCRLEMLLFQTSLDNPNLKIKANVKDNSIMLSTNTTNNTVTSKIHIHGENVLERNEIHVRTESKKKKDLLPDAKNMIHNGKSVAEVAESTNMSTSYLYKLLSKANKE